MGDRQPQPAAFASVYVIGWGGVGGAGGMLPKWEIQFASDKRRFASHTSSEEGSLHYPNKSIVVFSGLNCLAY